MPQNPGALKRQKEIARLEWQKEKAEKKKQRKLEKAEEEKGTPSRGPSRRRPQARFPGLRRPSLFSQQKRPTPASPSGDGRRRRV